jgi:hypothetical protein
MRGQGTIVRVSGRQEVTYFDTARTPLEYLQEAVGGYIELVPNFTTVRLDDDHADPVPCIVFCDEEGKLNRKPINVEATRMWDMALRRLPSHPNGLTGPDNYLTDYLVGDIVIITGDAKFLASQ